MPRHKTIRQTISHFFEEQSDSEGLILSPIRHDLGNPSSESENDFDSQAESEGEFEVDMPVSIEPGGVKLAGNFAKSLKSKLS